MFNGDVLVLADPELRPIKWRIDDVIVVFLLIIDERHHATALFLDEDGYLPLRKFFELQIDTHSIGEDGLGTILGVLPLDFRGEIEAFDIGRMDGCRTHCLIFLLVAQHVLTVFGRVRPRDHWVVPVRTVDDELIAALIRRDDEVCRGDLDDRLDVEMRDAVHCRR